ncbi:hypothetical protein Pan241w_26910 [Gimesia alba]|uniref:Carboxypeptidase regulatory-like domain-containing protein n=1 Tax=Gimesia alba TaxID=2527973 RepID=A0A517RFI2_9PLAN|nr:hypothetical protein [Gimesia alba]QDT42605.1 hypothetical protein Pan241w_26910 [Gimesia alba]
MQYLFKRLLFLFVLCLLVTGCTQGPTDTPPLARVNGKVMLDGKPLPSGSVQFTPDKNRGTTGRMALGNINEDGTFELMTIRSGDGAQVGYHLVAIESYASAAFDPNQPVNQAPKSLIPKHYTDPETSELTAEVKSGEENFLLFDLKSKP